MQGFKVFIAQIGFFPRWVERLKRTEPALLRSHQLELLVLFSLNILKQSKRFQLQVLCWCANKNIPSTSTPQIGILCISLLPNHPKINTTKTVERLKKIVFQIPHNPRQNKNIFYIVFIPPRKR